MIAVVVNGEVAKRFRYGWTARKVCSELDKQFGRGSLESEDLFAVDPDGEEVLEAGEYVYKIQAAGGAISSEQNDRLEKVLLRLEERTKPKVPAAVSVSKVDSGIWQEVATKAQLTVKPYTGEVSATEHEEPAMFGWDDRLERSQADRYMPHMNKILSFDPRRYQLVDAANHHTLLLSVKGLADQLGYEFKGSTDVVIALKQSVTANLPATGLRIIFELKKSIGGGREQYQAMISLLLANVLSCELKPVVVLTDLRKAYTFYWLDQRTIYYYSPERPGKALGIIEGLLLQEKITPETQVERVEGLIEKELPMVKRKRLNLEIGAEGEDVARLADLGLPAGELRACATGALIREFHEVPCIAAWRPSPSSMFG